MAGTLIGAVNNGEYSKTAASQNATKANETTSTSKSEEKKESGYSQDMFLKLLVAEMQYQDPMQPSDNSQYVAQLASFTQIEAMQAVQNDMHAMQANSLVGKVVVVNSDNQEVEGRVDFVTSDDDGNMYVSINDKQYKIDDIDSVVDETYYSAVSVVRTFNEMVAKLPSVENITLFDEKNVTDVMNVFNAMDSYTQSFVSEDTVKQIKAIAERLDALKKAKEEADKNTESIATDDTTETVEV